MSDDTASATKTDIGRLEGRTQKLESSVQRLEGSVQRLEGSVQRLEGSVQRLEGSVQRLEQKFERLYEADDQILTVLTNIDKRLTVKVEDHEKRIVRLEEAVA